jgi:DNA-binding GntR family transcriptional regulator
MIDSLRDAAELYRRWSQPHDPDRDVAGEHRRILKAALARDADAATSALAAHFERTAQILRATSDLAPDDAQA